MRRMLTCDTVREAVIMAERFGVGDYWCNYLDGPLESGMLANRVAHDTHLGDSLVMELRTKWHDVYKGVA